MASDNFFSKTDLFVGRDNKIPTESTDLVTYSLMIINPIKCEPGHVCITLEGFNTHDKKNVWYYVVLFIVLQPHFSNVNHIPYNTKRKPPCIGGMELVSLSCNRVFISAECVGRGWCKIAIATKWYQFIPPINVVFFLCRE